MFNERKDAIHKVARILRASRKQSGLNQASIAKKLGISQASISKIEAGRLTLTPEQWYSLCEFANIFPDKSWYTGCIDRCESRELQDGNREGSFKIPTRYAHLRGSKVRAILPFLNYFGHSLGKEKLKDYLKKVKIDEDFFVVLDNQLNIDFNLDLLRTMIDKGVLNKRNIPTLGSFYKNPLIHGNLASTYQAEENKIKRVINLAKKIKNYDVNCDYQIENASDRFIEISVIPNEHLRNFNYKDATLNDCLCLYKKEALKAFEYIGNYPSRSAPTMKLEEVECHFHSHSPKCVYRLEVI